MKPAPGMDHSSAAAAPGLAIRRTLQLLDLFCAQTHSLSHEHLTAFDEALLGVMPLCAVGERTALAERVGELAVVPFATLSSLARDVIGVARPVLERSLCLGDQDLIAVALECSAEHRLAIGGRRRVSPPVTDVLIDWRERPLLRVLAGNPGARLSSSGASILLDEAAGDETLQDLLGRRLDLDVVHLRRLVAMVDQETRRRVDASLASGRAKPPRPVRPHLDLATGIERARRRYDDALATVRAVAASARVGEADVMRAAEAGDAAAVICALAAMADLPVVVVEGIYDAREPAVLLVVLKAVGASWRTVRALLGLRFARPVLRSAYRSEEASFDAVPSASAGRILAFLREREIERLAATSA